MNPEPPSPLLAALVQAVIDGTDKAVRKLMGSFRLSYEVAQEVVQAAVVDLLGHWRRNGPPSDITKPVGYLIHTATHIFLRSAKRHRKLRFTPDVGDSAGPYTDPVLLLIDQEEANRLWTCVETLEFRQRIVVMLARHGYSAREIGSILGCSPVHVRVLKHQAIQEIRKKLGLADSA